MKKKLHPKYEYVVFQDISSDFATLTRSTIPSEETIKWEDGETYPLIKIDISSKSHPFYTGKQRMVDTENRVKTFEQRSKRASKQTQNKRTKRRQKRSEVQEVKVTKGLTLKDMLKSL